ncbi:unnamed protein product, partial [Larinioides sclopetarius]
MIMSGARRKVPLKRKILNVPEGVLPQLEYSNEKPEWHKSILRIKGSTTLIKRSPDIPKERKTPRKSKRVRHLGYLAMLDEREKFRSTLLKAFKPFEEKETTSGKLSRSLTAEERQWLKYEYYLRKLIPTDKVATLAEKNIEKILSLVPDRLKVGMEAHLEKAIQQIREEYIWVVKKSAVDSLMFSCVPKKSAYNPTSTYYKEMASFAKMPAHRMRRQKRKLSEVYILSNKCILKVMEAWLSTGGKLSFVDMHVFKKEELYEVPTYLQVVKMQVLNAQDKLHNNWYPLVQRIMSIGVKKSIIPPNQLDSFFNCVESIMISQLKSLFYESSCRYEKYVCHFEEHIGGLKVKLIWSKGSYELKPPIGDIVKAVADPFDLMRWAVAYFSRIENCLQKDSEETARDFLKTSLPENVMLAFKQNVLEFLQAEWKSPL